MVAIKVAQCSTSVPIEYNTAPSSISKRFTMFLGWRMESVAVGSKTLVLPSLVPSISSFETQLDPIAALQLQYALREPVTLVSAYDLNLFGSSFVDLCRRFKETGVLLLDSGGYEHSHASRYAGKGYATWTFEAYKAACELQLHDFAFSFDYFWRDNDSSESYDDFELRLVGELFNEHSFVAKDALIPVLHLHTRSDETQKLSEEQILQLVKRVASECKSPFIAIPERELGDGLIEKFKLAKKICDALSETPGVGLHVLGCGNPLSFAYLAAAGARMADGLEWYRTYISDNFHLHHFQQEPVLPNAGENVGNPTAELILKRGLPYRVKVATMNLMSLQAFSTELSPLVRQRTVHQLVQKNYGLRAGTELQGLEA